MPLDSGTATSAEIMKNIKSKSP